MYKRRGQGGFHVIEILIAIAFIGVIGFIGWRVFTADKTTDTPATVTPQSSEQRTTNPVGFVEWSFDGNTWKAMGNPPACENPLKIGAPMDVSKATSVLYPGQVRGSDFKPHGGIGIDGASNNKITVSTIRDAYLYRGARYIEQGETQYLIDFMDSCGVMFRLDHLATLTDEFKKYVNQLPEPQVDQSRTEKFKDPAFIPKGTVVATEAGFKKTKNAFFDLGVYDLRAPNAASKTDVYKTDSMRISDKEQSFYSVCWFDLLPDAEKTTVKALLPRGGASESSSDYCN